MFVALASTAPSLTRTFYGSRSSPRALSLSIFFSFARRLAPPESNLNRKPESQEGTAVPQSVPAFS